MNYYKIISRSMMLAICSLLIPIGCKKEEPLKIAGEEAENVDAYLRQLAFDPDDLLNVQENGSLEPVEKILEENRTVNGINICTNRTIDLSRNFDEVAILRPNQNIVWPGALCKVNNALFSGLPEPLTLKRAPVQLAIDLPNIGGQGNLTVNTPSEGKVRESIDQALDWWNNNAYQDGYVNPANITHQVVTSYSKEQLGIGLGLNIQWASGDVAAELNHTSTQEKYVTLMSFKQGFYTVSMETPERPACVFGNGVTLEDVQAEITAETPAAYIQSVTYGRILFFRMETSTDYDITKIRAAMRWATGGGLVHSDLKSDYEEILTNSQISMVVIGGNADGGVKALDIDGDQGLGSLETYIEDFATYGKDNPGVPIGYTMRSLSDNRLIKMGFQTNYQYADCSPIPKTMFYYKNHGVYTARAHLKYTYNGRRLAKDSGDILIGNDWSAELPEGSHQIDFNVEFLFFFGDWRNVFYHSVPAGENRCYASWGTTGDTQYCYKINTSEKNCNNLEPDCP